MQDIRRKLNVKKQRRFPSSLWIVFALAFLYLPLVIMAVFSFNDSKSLSSWSGFSLRWYQELFVNQQMIDAIIVSVSIAILSTVVSTVLGTITAIGISKSKPILRKIVLQVNNLPIMNPDIVTGISLMLLFSFVKVEKGYLTMLLAHIAFCTPFVITNVLPKVRQLDVNLADAAMDLGATPFQALTKVIIPQIKPGIISGALLAFTMSFDDFIISYFVSGNGIENISIVIYNMSKRTNPSIYALATIILVVVLLIVMLGTIIPKVFPKVTDRIMSSKIVKVVLAGCLLLSVGWSISTGVGKKTLRVYNWGEYIDKTVISDFEDEYDCRIIYETFDSNEIMYTKYMSGNSYDVMVPSEYMIERMIKEDLLQPIDKSLISNFDNINKDILGQSFDSDNNYWIPYFCGNVGILYDKTIVDKNDLKEGWNIFRNPKYKGQIYMYDSERDSFMVALKALGYSMNTTVEKEIDEAYQWLIDQRSEMEPVYVGDESIDTMISGVKAMAIMYSGDATTVMSENPNMEYYLPEEGTNVWFDGFVISKECKQTKLANQFINFMISNENSYKNTVEVGYLTANVNAAKKAAEEDYEGLSAYQIRTNAKDEVFSYQNNEVKEMYNSRWTKVKAK
ncbi:extracellular solute-binding protein [Thomasclavelia saccharogumia]|uniref:extracellular solute-binding protein n=1 Tax=Thomasclavelia saccharogumia TaxID=341225 RepID=UPI0011CC18ED|nr:extracellular solute-binding protein [Thomasclavelia saccharogumia]